MSTEDGCTCDACGKRYRVDVLLPDDLWAAIQPPEKPAGAGLLCGVCIFTRLECRQQFMAFSAVPAP